MRRKVGPWRMTKTATINRSVLDRFEITNTGKYYQLPAVVSLLKPKLFFIAIDAGILQ